MNFPADIYRGERSVVQEQSVAWRWSRTASFHFFWFCWKCKWARVASVSICLGAQRKIQSEEASRNRQVRNPSARIWQSFNTITGFWVLLALICPSFKAFINFETHSSVFFASRVKWNISLFLYLCIAGVCKMLMVSRISWFSRCFLFSCTLSQMDLLTWQTGWLWDWADGTSMHRAAQVCGWSSSLHLWLS